jgi:hypothetical protein
MYGAKKLKTLAFLVILSEAKDLVCVRQILRFAQDDDVSFRAQRGIC